jgi:aspartate kinase
MSGGLVVQKYGGSSVADAARLFNVARRIVETYDRGHPVCAVVSARGDTTDDLVRQALQVSPQPAQRELDVLLSAGEGISCSLLAMAVNRLGRKAVSLTGPQTGIITDSAHGRAQIVEIHTDRIRAALDEGKIALVAGFQGVSRDADVTTLGRGGSDTTAVALASALHASVCDLHRRRRRLHGQPQRSLARAAHLRDYLRRDDRIDRRWGKRAGDALRRAGCPYGLARSRAL